MSSSYPEYLSPSWDKETQQAVVWTRLQEHRKLARQGLAEIGERYKALRQEQSTRVESRHESSSRDIIPPERFTIATNKGVEPNQLLKVPPSLKVRRAIMSMMHNHPSAGHPGRDKTLRKVQQHYQWPGMKQWIADYIRGCATCQQNKILTHRTKVPIYRIPTSEGIKPFQQVSMDLITGLPSRNGYDAILTIVDHGCSRVAIFLPCTTKITGLGIAQLYLDHIY